MGVLRWLYHCNDCNEDKYSYFSNLPKCPYCNNKDISKLDITDKNIDKFDEEGMRLRKKELNHTWNLREESL